MTGIEKICAVLAYIVLQVWICRQVPLFVFLVHAAIGNREHLNVALPPYRKTRFPSFSGLPNATRFEGGFLISSIFLYTYID